MEDYRPSTSAEATAACAEYSAAWRAIIQHMDNNIQDYPPAVQQLYARLQMAIEWREDVARRIRYKPPHA